VKTACLQPDNHLSYQRPGHRRQSPDQGTQDHHHRTELTLAQSSVKRLCPHAGALELTLRRSPTPPLPTGPQVHVVLISPWPPSSVSPVPHHVTASRLPAAPCHPSFDQLAVGEPPPCSHDPAGQTQAQGQGSRTRSWEQAQAQAPGEWSRGRPAAVGPEHGAGHSFLGPQSPALAHGCTPKRHPAAACLPRAFLLLLPCCSATLSLLTLCALPCLVG
jgi:hypothetical protein